MNVNRDKIIDEAKKFLIKLKSDLELIKIIEFQSITFNSSEFRTAEILNGQIKKIQKSELPLIYTIELVQIDKLPNLLKSFETFSVINKEKTNKDRVNVSKYNKTNSEYLYVGSSTTDIHSRIKNHLGTRSIKVYSLHLCKWDNDLNYDLALKTYQVSNNQGKKIDRILVELLEQQLWDKLKPNFGKRSGQ